MLYTSYSIRLQHPHSSVRSDFNTLTHLFVHCAVLLVMATQIRKTFTTDVGHMLLRGHHMTARDL